MKRRSIFSVMMAAGLVLGSATSTLMLGSSSALADNDRVCNDCPRRNDIQKWREYCDRHRDFIVCRSNNYNYNRGWYGNAPDRGRLYAGTFIPTRSYRRQRIVLKRWQRYPLQLVVSRPIANYKNNRTIIPYGSVIDGALIPWNGGYRYQSYRVRFPDGRSEGLAAYSPYLDSYDRFDRNNTDGYNLSPEALLLLISFLGGKSYTPSASVLGGLFDQHDTVRRDLAVVYPNQDLDLRLANDFVLD